MQQHNWIFYKEAVCPICYGKFMFADFLEQPPTCGKLECLQKYHFKGLEKFADTKTLCQNVS